MAACRVGGRVSALILLYFHFLHAGTVGSRGQRELSKSQVLAAENSQIGTEMSHAIGIWVGHCQHLLHPTNTWPRVMLKFVYWITQWLYTPGKELPYLFEGLFEVPCRMGVSSLSVWLSSWTMAPDMGFWISRGLLVPSHPQICLTLKKMYTLKKIVPFCPQLSGILQRMCNKALTILW